MAEQENGSSPLAEALARVGDRWTLLVVEALPGGPQRFNDLPGQIPGIAAHILSERLKRLEREGLLAARPCSERPPRVACLLTAEGTELAGAAGRQPPRSSPTTPTLVAMCTWSPYGKSARHDLTRWDPGPAAAVASEP